MPLDWSEIHFGKLTRAEISKCVADSDWQEVRASLHYKSLMERHITLKNYLEKKEYSRCARVQVTNYINSLKRGGMIRISQKDKEE